jgi:hypothetical protein
MSSSVHSSQIMCEKTFGDLLNIFFIESSSYTRDVASPVFLSLLEKRFETPAIHFWYGLITVADTKNEFLFFCIG